MTYESKKIIVSLQLYRRQTDIPKKKVQSKVRVFSPSLYIYLVLHYVLLTIIFR